MKTTSPLFVKQCRGAHHCQVGQILQSLALQQLLPVCVSNYSDARHFLLHILGHALCEHFQAEL